ncbi:hypothetical protein [Streptomyces ramulosus]|uniref:hypothetical protein n=1 Tax=Streptomyces TaxID=1883 RepID=UPI0031E57ABC
MSNLPSTRADGAGNGYQALQAKLKRLQGAADQLSEQVGYAAQRMKRNSSAADTVADMSAAAQADSRHVAAIGDVADAFGQVAVRGRRVVAAADGVSQAAGQLRSTHQNTYGGIQAAVTSSRARQAKPGFYRQP